MKTTHENIITFTKAAINHIERVMAKRGKGIGFRISIKQTGCSGYMYKPEIIDEERPHDIKLKEQGLPIYIDPKGLDLITGTRVDFVKKELGIEQLEFQNPNAESLCGCGESFNLKANENE